MITIHSGQVYKYESGEGLLQPRSIQTKEYAIPYISSYNDSSLTFQPALPSDINVFKDLSKETLSIHPISCFLRDLEKSILRQSRQGITLSKLTDTRQDDGSVLIEWMFINFRVTIQFDNGNSFIYCLAFYDPDNNKYSSLCESFKEEEFQKVSDIVVDFVYQHI